ncbi:hypothetical protein D9613_006680 [Agrocybe pediades]|uniref:Uncharacterized protein n=1 Tax=Agrocybe pediades TaxID=84607 RepID=A0A8H4QGA6_9AGAR|nr:hypothetical protein D9613_006680 [Agrocybe pediades]
MSIDPWCLTARPPSYRSTIEPVRSHPPPRRPLPSPNRHPATVRDVPAVFITDFTPCDSPEPSNDIHFEDMQSENIPSSRSIIDTPPTRPRTPLSKFWLPIRFNAAPSLRSVSSVPSFARPRQGSFPSAVPPLPSPARHRQRSLPSENLDQECEPDPFPFEKSPSSSSTFLPQSAPARNVIYSFMPTGLNTMALVPSRATGSPNLQEPQYKITVNMNCFIPSSYITQIHRDHQMISQFEMGVKTSPNSLKIADYDGFISSFLSKSGSRNKGTWFWNPLNIGLKYCLKWDYDKRPCTCRSTAFGDGPILAYFSSPYGLESTSSVAILEITPAGQEYVDHILTSLMIIERKRLTPE